jgi:hypothetical protein
MGLPGRAGAGKSMYRTPGMCQGWPQAASSLAVGTGAAGVALSVVRDDDKVREHALFVEAEANRWIGRGFVGGGVGLWDLTRSDTITPVAMVHVGLPVADQIRFPIYFLLEGRLFLDNADDIDNNYQFWGGIRIRF